MPIIGTFYLSQNLLVKALNKVMQVIMNKDWTFESNKILHSIKNMIFIYTDIHMSYSNFYLKKDLCFFSWDFSPMGHSDLL